MPIEDIVNPPLNVKNLNTDIERPPGFRFGPSMLFTDQERDEGIDAFVKRLKELARKPAIPDYSFPSYFTDEERLKENKEINEFLISNNLHLIDKTENNIIDYLKIKNGSSIPGINTRPNINLLPIPAPIPTPNIYPSQPKFSQSAEEAKDIERKLDIIDAATIAMALSVLYPKDWTRIKDEHNLWKYFEQLLFEYQNSNLDDLSVLARLRVAFPDETENNVVYEAKEQQLINDFEDRERWARNRMSSGNSDSLANYFSFLFYARILAPESVSLEKLERFWEENSLRERIDEINFPNARTTNQRTTKYEVKAIARLLFPNHELPLPDENEWRQDIESLQDSKGEPLDPSTAAWHKRLRLERFEFSKIAFPAMWMRILSAPSARITEKGSIETSDIEPIKITPLPMPQERSF